MAGFGAGGATGIRSEIVDLFLQSIGVTLTDVDDVVFRLNYFERQNRLMAKKRLIAEVSTHYTAQGLRQLYVLVLGLDVIGNPFGLAMGIGQGAKDLFYEPIQGAVQVNILSCTCWCLAWM
ncbi:unnamed protein product [Notodromas monacha]|uniref:Uncharacterized protein n=1 Tax=Notodromas monacha TaxID=399045 RepID=A0A7R9C112_9CRUS|nr:unnamed protein product [Notodromas monacha]CAG0924924.1 unnamed protein product [Notodromas monacha]